jgi:hypothetical protein
VKEPRTCSSRVMLDCMDNDTKLIGGESINTEVNIRMPDGSDGTNVLKGKCVDMLLILIDGIRVEEIMLFHNLPELISLELALMCKFDIKLVSPTVT